MIYLYICFPGDITVADNLVREPVETKYNIVVQAIDNGAPGLSSSTNITVSVPINHPPTIKRSFYFYVLENNKAGLFIGNIVADDPDLHKVKGEKLTFFIADKSGENIYLKLYFTNPAKRDST